MGVLTVFVVWLLAQTCSAHRHDHRHSHDKEYPMEGSQLAGDAAGLARALSGNEVEKADVMREVLPPGEVERARADLEIAAADEDKANSPSGSGQALGEDILSIAKMQRDTQSDANVQAGRNQQLAEEDEALVRKVRNLRQKNHMLKNHVKMAKVDLDQSREKMANKVKEAFKTFLTNTRILRDELKRDGVVLEKDAKLQDNLREEVKVEAEELASAKKRIEQQRLAREAADAKAKENNAKWQRLVVNLTDSFQADEKSIARLRVLRELDTKTIDKGAAMLRDLKKESTAKESALAERLAKSEDDRQAERGALADQIAATRKQHAAAESVREALLKEQEKVKAENFQMEQALVQKDHESIAARQKLEGEMQEQEKQYKVEVAKMTGAFQKAGADIVKIEKIDRGLAQKLNYTRTEVNGVRKEVAAEKAENVKLTNQTRTLTNQTRTLLANNKALLEKVKQLKEQVLAKAVAPPPPPPPTVEEQVAEEQASRAREREVAAVVAAEQASHNRLLPIPRSVAAAEKAPPAVVSPPHF